MSDLQTKTQAYWNMSHVFHVGIGKAMTMEVALDSSNELLEQLGPHRKLKLRMYALQDRLIQGRKSKASKAKINNVRKLFG